MTNLGQLTDDDFQGMHDDYQRALGRAVAQLADDADVPRAVIGYPVWLMPDANPFPRFQLWRVRSR